MYMHAQRFDRIFRILTENDLAKLQQRHLESISATAEERYESFLNDYSNLTNRLSQVQIASFLGITPEFLSRLRNRQVRSSSENEKESPHGIS
jgi:CRP-like cAMP-binding protein